LFKFPRLNPTAESILKILAERPANPDNLAFVLRCDEQILGRHLRFLLTEGYVATSKFVKDKPTLIYPREKYYITVVGENYLASVRFISIRDKRQFWINIVNAAVSWTALIKAFWNEISEVLQQLAR